MATSLAAQLNKIASQSRSSLNIKTVKAAHAKSLLFEARVAATQSFPEIYSLCHDGFEELCHLDPRFSHYATNLFSNESQDAERNQMTAEENAALDRRVESFLHLVGGRLRLLPAIKAIEWLIRRFRIHEFNTATLITTFLPFHTIPAFVTLLSILPRQIPDKYRFLDPYIRSLTAPPRAAIVQQATNRPEILSTISEYTLESCRSEHEYPGLISFWGGIMVEAVNGMLDKMRSGRKSIQMENNHTLLQQIAPVLSEAMVMKEVPGLQIASYMIVAVLASKGSLDDGALSAFMDQLVLGWTAETFRSGLVCLCILSQYRSAKQLSSRVAKALLKLQQLTQTLQDINQDHRVDRLANGLALALVDRLSKKGDIRSLPAVKSLLLGNVLQEKQAKVVYKAMLLAAHKINDDVDQDGRIRKELGSVLVSLSQAAGDAGDAIRAAIDDVEFDIEELELKLGTSIRSKLIIEQPLEDLTVDKESGLLGKQEKLEVALQRLSNLEPQTSSCLSEEPTNLLDELFSVFLSAAASEGSLPNFDNAPVLSRLQAPRESFYFSFYVRIWCGQFPTLARVAALEEVKARLKEEDCTSHDFQALIPYCIVALSDSAKKVRRAAADLMAVLGPLFAEPAKSARPVWGSEDLYAKSDVLSNLAPDASKSLVQSVLLPSLEESVIHEDHVLAALSGCLEKKDTEKKHLSHATRLSILKFLCSHVVATPILTVKLCLLKPLNKIRSISGTSRTDLLLPLLKWWASLPETEASQLAIREQLDEVALDAAFVDIVVANSAVGLETLLDFIKEPRTASRPNLVQAIFTRLGKIWPSMKSDTRFSMAKIMLALSQTVSRPSSGPSSIPAEAADLLRKVELTTDILLDFLQTLQEGVNMVIEPPAAKRRRVSASEQNRSVSLQGSPELNAVLNNTTFILELVQESNPQDHPELLTSLFNALADLQHLRTLIGSELGYLQNLVLSSLLAMMPAFKNDKNLTIDASVGHGDVLAACIQKSSSPTVINAALLLVASLAKTAPEVVLQSVMPIFTFMGGSVLKQADDYSAHVINQTVKEVIPPLIDTFRRTRRNLVASTSELLTSFVTAYEHVPSHRKYGLFVSLIENLGPEDFLFAVLAMFVDKYGATDSMVSFTTQLLSHFSVEIQLQTLIKFLDLVSDIFKPKPTLSATLLGKNDHGEKDPAKTATKQLALLPHLLANRRLRREITQLAERDDMDSARIRDLYATLLESLLTLASTVKTKKPLYNRCGDALSNLLNLLSIAEFIKSVEALLDRPKVGLRQKVLRALELRVDSEGSTDPKSRTALLAFLPQLTAVIRESDDMDYKHTAVTCVDKIAEKYGKKDIEAVAAAAATIVGDHCLGQSSQTLRIMALLCLASLVDVLQDGIVPVLPAAIPKALAYIEESIGGEKPNPELHNAAYAFIAALAQHIPYMMSGAYLDRLLACSNSSAAAGLDEESNSNRSHCLQLLAKLVDPKALFVALEKNWAHAAASGFAALTEYLQIVGMALEKHPKSVIAKNITSISAIFLSALDLRRLNATNQTGELGATELAQVESAINDDALKMIYKLNDAAFRPVFARFVEWSWSGLPKSDVAGRTLRLLSLYSLLDTFFGSLKSIVTSYASNIVESAVAVLGKTDFKEAGEKELWKQVLCTLIKCFEHDQDGFWQAPAHFNAVAPVLTGQFLLAGTIESTEELALAVVELAAAADSKEHYKELNGALLKHLRSEQPAVRLAVVKCEQELTARLGEEWLQSLPEMLPYISELQDDDDETVERENRRWIVAIEQTLGESLDSMLQ
ncbi:hypothetical protein B0T24DRAFT_172635 [Lasiosphaeria ovina]|uniref:U3 small nucleolar RNA-associated protein 10 n=1 Tax=Lasiosphaeria ovina TaxID=92902 RepID=A0AAE0NE74_9PEZI|nr:hypothetical protein B0T24DRAFT_172635 [Lasiosphaeria ovina]